MPPHRLLCLLACALSLVLGFPAPTSARAVPDGPSFTGVGEFVADVVHRQLRRDAIPGAAVVVVSGGRTVLAEGYGVADISTGRAVDARTGFFTGSLAKAFTATAALQLVKAGKLDLDADVNRYLKSFSIADAYPGRPVTLGHLLTYTAGFDEDLVGLAAEDPNDVVTLAESLADRQPPRVRPPGEHAAYDNYGVALAGHLVELASGMPYARYVEEHVLRPLGMRSTSMAVPHPGRLDAALAGAYRPSGGGQTPVRGQYGPWAPSGTGPVTTPSDMARFLVAQLADDPRLGDGVPALLRARQRTEHPALPGMGHILEERPRNGRALLYKNGDVPGHHSAFALLPESGTGIYVAYNGDGTAGSAAADVESLIDAFVDRYFPAEGSSAAPTLSGSPEDVSAYAGTYRSLRTSRSSLMKAASLFSAPTVEAHEDGSLTTTGLSADPARATQHWDPEGGGVFRERDGQDRLAFTPDGTLATTMNPAETWERLAWYAAPFPHVLLLGVSALLLALIVLLTPLAAVARAVRRRPVPTPFPHMPTSARRVPAFPAMSRAASLLTWTAAALCTAFITGIAVVMADPNAVNELLALGAPPLTALPWLPTAALLCALLGTVPTAFSLRRRTPTITLASFIPFLLICHHYHLVALPF
ncbi:beta-lactamase family protein [Actinocorallia sp. API 0066]|uniref:serine hydrolase domain-containing protein n=1 Tax=Actinocorallia sp. API 0066 TaxID=2896846 RepID=UPI001E3525BC|nr:serine hydrolase domain-containing protein [Actinocorallia sp. API 0066]MCD0448342.1 beta-lactamase family protein [Actinocorallia sp. API 0066]